MKPSNMALAAQAAHDLSFLLQCQYALHVHHPEECLSQWAVLDLEEKLADFAALLGYELVKMEDAE